MLSIRLRCCWFNVAALVFASLTSCNGLAQNVPYPGPVPNQPPANAPLEAKYAAQGPYAVSQLVGVLDTSGNSSNDQFGVPYPCTSLTTSGSNLGNASNFPSNTVPYDIWYPSNIGQYNTQFPVVIFGGGFNPPTIYVDSQGRPVSSTFFVTPDNASSFNYMLSHLASWGFVVIGTQSGLTGSGLQDVCAAEFASYIQTQPGSLTMVQEVQQRGPATMSGINEQGASVSNVGIMEMTPALTPVTAVVNGATTVVGGIYSTNTTPNVFYGKLNVNEIGALGHSEGSYGVVSALIDSKEIIKTAVSLEEPAAIWCNNQIIPWFLGYSEPLDNVCQKTSNITSGSVFFINGSQDTVVAPSTQSGSCASGELSTSCLYSDVPLNIPKAWATLNGANHQDPGGSPWCVTYEQPNSSGGEQPYTAAINYWIGQGLQPDSQILVGPPATASPCGANYAANAVYGNNPEYGGAFGYLGYVTAWMLDTLQGNSAAHSVFVWPSGELFSETTNWQNQITNMLY